MEWLLVAGIFLILIIAIVAGLIFYKKNKELNKKIKDVNKQREGINMRLPDKYDTTF